ncbi:hypothetical protein CfE428DRAFT_6647 [Chthoniobacter flavus Ellin428]|uniref:Uncharacterized protein n=1 Tax=Chthoniobacter flavus Ellin428 TaxID=497964 RepID=B4DCK6_9BACT|nr:hypothetical protein [Chthoniobacter flavus]EDY15820.1 hypothetical protein CfE428DRAFT_6647 [Chthoniobacter flavus Ellin428]TCO81861.1 hypothetical protein EV701_1522 [Chthoniobacter flavus]
MSETYSDRLTVADFKKHAVWEYTSKDESVGPDAELAVKPVIELPVTTMEGRFIGTELVLGNGRPVFGVLLGIKLNNARLTRLILSVIVYSGERKFLFRRSSSTESAIQGLAGFLGLSQAEVFPIRYDISAYALSAPDVVVGEIPLTLSERLPKAELFKLILEEQVRARRQSEWPG